MSWEYKKEVLCPECNEFTKPEITDKKIHFKIQKDDIEVNAERAKCTNCSEEFLVEGIIDGYEEAYNLYRERHKLLLPEEIKEIRSKYGLNQKTFSKLLGFGEITIHRYEKGAIQEKSADELIRMAKNPENLQKIFETNPNVLNEKELEEFKVKLDIALKEMTKESIHGRLLKSFEFNQDEYNGFKVFDYSRLKNLILLFLENAGELFTTQIMKLGFYCDFMYFAKTGNSITGLRYKNADFGPIINNYDDLLCVLKEEGYIKGYLKGKGTYYVPLKHPDKNVFLDWEIKFIDNVVNELKELKSWQLSEKTHTEVDAWIETVRHELLSYKKYASQVKLK